ncbi:hypothetical protein ARMGADRAFT_881608, partial [Armillaria gallica]
GKTLMAGAVAKLLCHPLYMVGSSELPSLPCGLEHSLQSILSVSSLGSASLEHEPEGRDLNTYQLQCNALVSAALSVLVYHCGDLFLTTNRISSFDKAFLSHFSI